MYIVKIFGLVLMVADFAISKRWPLRLMDEWTALSEPFRDDCILQTKPDPNDIDRLTSEAYVANNDAICNYLTCLLQHFQVFDSATYMNAEVSDKCIREVYEEPNSIKKSCVFAKCILEVYAD
ncbi:hypothetical protein FQR65_LT09858 [Abscondita terminalis]|nr:hypothetical protein FQR65_LT09858 [Abscondita terminalis]